LGGFRTLNGLNFRTRCVRCGNGTHIGSAAPNAALDDETPERELIPPPSVSRGGTEKSAGDAFARPLRTQAVHGKRRDTGMHWRAIVIIVAVGVAGIGGLAIWRFAHVPGPPAAASRAPQAIPVTAGIATAKDVPVYVEGLGTVQAFNTVSVKTRVDGQITKV